VLDRGRFFGEIAIFLEGKRIAYVRAETYCSIYVLTKKDIDRVLRSYPAVQKKFMKEALKRSLITKGLAEKNKIEEKQTNETFSHFLMHFTLRAKEV
jgi:CRP-like cAMP-binding protein